MVHLSVLAQPDDPKQGLRRVVVLIEAGQNLTDLGLEDNWIARLESTEHQTHTSLYGLAIKAKALPHNNEAS